MTEDQITINSAGRPEMKNWVLLCLQITCATVLAQAPDTLWTRTYGGGGDDYGHAILQAGDGGYVVAGQTQSFGAGSWDGWLVRISEDGDSLWSRTYGGGSSDGFMDIKLTTDGGYVLAGWTFSFGNNNGNAFILKTNQNGDSLWSRTLGGNQYNDFRSIVVLEDGSIVVAGVDEDPDPVNGNMLFAKYSASGTLLWSHSYGGPGRQYCWDVSPTADNGFVLTGWTRVGPEHTGADFIVIRTGSSGDSLWSQTWGNGPSTSETLYNIEELENGDFFVAGDANAVPSNGVEADFYVARLDPMGNVIWSRTRDENATELLLDGLVSSQGGLLACGVSGDDPYYDAWLVRYSESGDASWTFRFEGTNFDEFNSLIESSDAGYVLSGFTTSQGAGGFDFYVVKLDTDPFHRGVFVTAPSGGEELDILVGDTIRWNGIGFDGGVSIELNRNYPNGAWETIAGETENDGAYEWLVTGPPSDFCRIRICSVDDTLCGVSDDDFAIISSDGFLQFVQSSSPNSPVTSWNAGVVECPQSVFQHFHVKNTGLAALVYFPPLEPSSAEFSMTTSCVSGQFGLILLPGQVSACSVRVAFDPSLDGSYNDFLRVPTSASNAINDIVSLPLLGEQISTPAAPEVVITTSGEHSILHWSAVDTSIGGCPVSDLRYLVFYAPTSGGPFYYHGFTTDTTYMHVGAVTYAPAMFYQVVAVHAPNNFLTGLERDLEMTEVMSYVNSIAKRAR